MKNNIYKKYSKEEQQIAKIKEAYKKGVPVWGESLCEIEDATPEEHIAAYFNEFKDVK